MRLCIWELALLFRTFAARTAVLYSLQAGTSTLAPTRHQPNKP